MPPFVFYQISDTVIEDRFGVKHGSDEWYEALNQHFKLLLQYRISPYFCRWGDGMLVLTYTSPWPAGHPKSDEHLSDPRLAAYAVPYNPAVSGNHAAKDYLQKEVEILRTKSHWKKAYFYLWDEPLNMEQDESLRNLASEVHDYSPIARVLTTYYCGPNDAPLAPTPFEAFVQVPRFLRPHTQIYCASEWVLGNQEDLVKDIISELQLKNGDGVLFYPGEVFPSCHEPVASLRLERILSGLQDIEYFKLYSSRYGREEGLALLEKTGMYLDPERYNTRAHAN